MEWGSRLEGQDEVGGRNGDRVETLVGGSRDLDPKLKRDGHRVKHSDRLSEKFRK